MSKLSPPKLGLTEENQSDVLSKSKYLEICPCKAPIVHIDIIRSQRALGSNSQITRSIRLIRSSCPLSAQIRVFPLL